MGILGFYYGGCPCVMGFVERIWLLPWGSPLSVVLIMLVIITITTLFKGRIFCGWVCPHGALQEFLFQVKISFPLERRVDSSLKILKYLFLIFIVLAAIFTGQGLFCRYEPFKAIYGLSASGLTLALVIVTLMASLVFYRPWCRYICPLGAYLGIIAWLGSRWGLNRTQITADCLFCRKCLRVCPINAIKEEGRGCKINYRECITCGDCLEACPTTGIKGKED
ncbi:MAG TPA: 4Fe-4S binding protein [Moorella mulderi]|nr:4Fe-4S binding protein [Moorella mulderi]